MPDTDSLQVLKSAHDRLVDVLADLDAVREHGAAAHIAAAIDLLEDRVVPENDAPRRQDQGMIATFARQMKTEFGARAPSVARRQLEESTGPTFVAWAAIISRMEE